LRDAGLSDPRCRAPEGPVHGRPRPARGAGRDGGRAPPRRGGQAGGYASSEARPARAGGGGIACFDLTWCTPARSFRRVVHREAGGPSSLPTLRSAHAAPPGSGASASGRTGWPVRSSLERTRRRGSFFIRHAGGGTIAIEKRVRVNRQIRISPVRVISAEGAQLGIMPVDEALAAAESQGL